MARLVFHVQVGDTHKLSILQFETACYSLLKQLLPDSSDTKHKHGMITPAQIRAARALLGMDQRQLAEAAGLSLPTIQRMEASEGRMRCNVDSLMRVVDAFEKGGVGLIAEGAVSLQGGSGVRFKVGESR